ncbi:hypothetical protein ABZS66_04640 [Dactylosporangium sp. NPDC005572]|uniref:hypothetical protein n=1 Tax=Dactylosporangium sp. NPDC005572 TaxID=3156889 RepID=UPI0033B087FA
MLPKLPVLPDIVRFVLAGLVAGLVTALAGALLVLAGPAGGSTTVTFVEYGTVTVCQR